MDRHVGKHALFVCDGPLTTYVFAAMEAWTAEEYP